MMSELTRYSNSIIRKKMKNRLFLCAMLMVCACSLLAQNELPKKVDAKKPEILNKNLLKLSDLEKEFKPNINSKWGQKKTVNNYWEAWSDRHDNTTYKKPRGTEPFERLDFGEKVIIAKIDGDWALVYQDARTDKFPAISPTAKSKGWIELDKLLLWKSCPADDRGVLQKALIAFNLNKIGQNEKMEARRYWSPVDNRQSDALKMDMNFYYVMKVYTDGNDERSLLCKQSDFTGNNLYGWVNKKNYAPWNQRTCLEPNWDPEYVESHKGQKAYVYNSDQLSDDSYATFWTFGTSNGDPDRSMMYRMKHSQLRFPILSQPVNNAVHCTSFADRTGSSNQTGGFSGDITDEVNSKSHKMQHMNIILAIEATTEMSKYMPAIQAALASCSSYASQGITAKVGAVLYRGDADQEDGIDIVPLTKPDDARLLATINAEKANGTLTGNERSVALPSGIEAATDINKMGFDKDERNLLLIIGNRGASSEDNTLESPQLLKRLTDNKIQMMSIQVMRNATGSWARYTDQVNKLITENVNAQYKSIGDEAKFATSRNNDGYSFKSTNRESVYFASTRYGSMGQGMAPADVTRYIQNGIAGFAKTIVTYHNTFEQAVNDIEFYPEFLKSILGVGNYAKWKELKAISAFGGYAKMQDSDGKNLWHCILYLSSGELEDLVKKLQRTSEAAQLRSQDRTHYLNAMRALLKAQLPEKTEKEIEAMSADDIQEAIYGLNVPTASMNLKKYSIKDLANSSVVNNAEYFEILNNFASKYEELRRLQNSGYKYRVEVNNVFYYWIPIEDLP